MAEPSELELNKVIDDQIIIVGNILRRALKRFNPGATQTQNLNAAAYVINMLKEVRGIPNPTVRERRYNEIIKELMEKPTKYGVLGFFTHPYNKGFEFNRDEKADFMPVINALEKAQTKLNDLYKTEKKASRITLVVEVSQEGGDHKLVRENLAAQIEALKALRKSMKSDPVKSLYKRAKKHILDSKNVQHYSKTQLLDEMIASLETIAKEANANKTKPESTAAGLNGRIAGVIQQFEAKKEQRVVHFENAKAFNKIIHHFTDPFMMSSRNIISPLPEQLAKQANEITRESKEARDLFDIIHSLENNPKHKNKPSKAREKNVQVGDVISLFAVTSAQKRDQLVIDSVNQYMNKYPNSRITQYCDMINLLNTLKDELDKLNVNLLKYNHVDDIKSAMESSSNMMDARLSLLREKCISSKDVNQDLRTKIVDEMNKFEKAWLKTKGKLVASPKLSH